MSAIGSETFMVLPARLRDAGQLADERALAEADAAQREPAHVRTRASADGAPGVRLDRERRRSLRLRDHCLLGHWFLPALAGEGHAEQLKQALGLLVGLRR